MLNTTLIYIERDGKYLMLHRTKKENDLNHDKWIGVGGKCEEDESPEECARREAYEETGLTLRDLRYRGIVTFVSDEYEGEDMHLFTCTDWEGQVRECPKATSCGSRKKKCRTFRAGKGTGSSCVSWPNRTRFSP